MLTEFADVSNNIKINLKQPSVVEHCQFVKDVNLLCEWIGNLATVSLHVFLPTTLVKISNLN